jgi:hypothetical protein
MLEPVGIMVIDVNARVTLTDNLPDMRAVACEGVTIRSFLVLF